MFWFFSKKEVNMKKRGQITLFIIVGIILLLAIAVFIMYQKQIVVFKPERVIPPEIAPLKRYVEDCAYTTAEKGIRLIGANGGFISFPEEIELDPASYLSVTPLFPELKTPLWRYRGRTRIPSEHRIKTDLEHYIEENLDTCLMELSPFITMFDIKKGNMSTIVDLTETGVEIELIYPLEIFIKLKNQTIKLDKFETTVPLRLKTLYELAKKIMQEENADLFLEETTIDLIALDSDIPYTDLAFTCKPKIWYVADVRDKLKHLLRTDLPLIRVDKTAYEPVPQEQLYVENHFKWEVTSLRYDTTHVSFTYDEKWPLELYIRPNEGPILRSNPQRGQQILSTLCIHIWHFTYDVRYPVLVTITDEAEKGHDRYTFNFAFEVAINHNRPDKTNFGITTFEFEPAARAERFCAEMHTNMLTVHTFENISTDEYGDLPYDPIDGVNITFTCIRLECPMGQSEYAFGGAVAWLQAEFPYCINGVLKGSKENYKDTQIFVSTDEEKSVDLYLTPLIKKNFTVVKHYQYDPYIEKPLEEEEMAIITIKRRNTTFSNAVYPPIEELAELKLLSGGESDFPYFTYDLEIFLADDKTGIIGGYSAVWTPDWTKLKLANSIKFHILEWPHTEKEYQQYLYITGLRNASKAIPEPEFIS